METTKQVIKLDELVQIKSSNIKQIGIDKAQKTVFVEFLNGSIYNYEEVKETEFEKLVKSESVGKFFNSSFKSNFKYNKIIDSELKKKEDNETTTPIEDSALSKE